MMTVAQVSSDHDKLKEAFVGAADSADLTTQPEKWRGTIIVGQKTFLLKVGIVFTLIAMTVASFLFYNLGFFPPLLLLIGLLAFGLVVFIQRLISAAYVLKIDENGIDNRTQGFGGGFCAWEEITDCRVVLADGRRMLGLVLTEKGRERQDFLSRAVLDSQREAVGCDVILPPEVFGSQDPENYAQFITYFLNNAAARENLKAVQDTAAA